MKIGKRTGFYISICLVLIFAIYMFTGESTQAADTDIPLPDSYFFVVGGQSKKPGTEIEMKDKQLLLQVSAEGWDKSTDVEWVSSEPGVVDIEPYNKDMPNYVNLVRKGPGYSTITAVVKYGTYTYSLSCLVKVNLQFDYQKIEKENKAEIRVATTTNERILIMNTDSNPYQLYLKYVDYVPEGETKPVSGSAISASLVTWESDNESVVTVDENGKVKAVGSGSATITATTNTMSATDKTLSDKLKIVVSPKFSLSFDDLNGNKVVANSNESNKNYTPVEGVPTTFNIESNAKYAVNLKWEVYDVSTKQKLSPTSSKLNYSVHDNDGIVHFSNVKAGTYEIYAFANDKYNANTNAPYAYMKIIVPINLKDETIVMNVGDTYSIVDNSNIPEFGIFDVSYGNKGDANIAHVDTAKGIITAKSKGKATIKLTYKYGSKLYDDDSVYTKDKTIYVTVIDGISLSTTQAVLYTQGTLLLQAEVTDRTEPIIWTSDAPNIAKVEDGLVTALRPGVAIITAQQIIDGVVKKATCEITVRQSVTNITVDPSEIDIAIGEYKTLKATISPKLSGIKLTWKTSNNKVVKITEANPQTVTVQGVSGGNAVISAINEENIVVGYCHVTVRQPVTSIKLSDTNVSISLGAGSLQLRAIVYPENATNKEINWTSSNTQVARVSKNGLVTLSSPGETTIIATSVDNPNAMALCTIKVEIPVTSVALDEKEVTMYVGQTKRLTYTVLPINASKNSVTWTSTNTSVATVDAAGKVTARQVGSTVIMLKSLDGGFTAYCTVNVRQIAEGVKFADNEIELMTGQVHELEYALIPANATDVNLIWESSDTKVAVVDDAGKVTAKGPGTAFIIVRTEAGGMSYIKVTVKQPVSGLILNFNEKIIHVKETFELKVSVTPSGASNLGVEWKSSNTNVATVSDKGEVTGIAVGTAIITCTTKDGGFTASCVVSVRDLLTSMGLNHSEYRLSINKSVTLSVVVDGKAVTDQQFKWVSSNSDIASVNKNGKVTGHKIGTATITAYATDGSGADASCDIQVVRPVTKVTLSKNYLNMFVGDTKQLKAKIEPSNATYKTPEWVIEGDKDVVMVDEDGYVTALKEGSVTIRAKAQDDSGKFAICQVIVNKRVPATSVVLSDKSIVMVQGEQKTIKPVLNPVNSTDSLTWSSDNSSVATVNSSGKITAKATGTAYVTAMTDSGKTATIEVNVIGLNVTKLELEQYSRYTLYVEGATSRVTWDVADPEIATVQNGVVVTKARGTTTITATVNGRRLTCKLTVVKIK